MSWILGIYKFDGNENSDLPKFPEKLNSYSVFQSIHFSIYSDINSNLVYSSIAEKSGKIISGIGIDIERSKIYLGDSWVSSDSFKNLDGQFAHISWNNEELTMNTDSAGLRKFYIYDVDENYVLFSTRLDLLTALIPNPTININALGSYYSLIFSLRQTDTIINDISSTSPGGKITITPNRYHEQVKQWKESHSSDIDIVELLCRFTSVSKKNGFDTTLCISAGLDSRTLLALMNKEIPGEFSNFCTGAESLPDLLIAKDICKNEELFLSSVPYTPENIPNLYQFLQKISLRTNMLFGLENALFFDGVNSIKNENSILIDGAFGELLRAMLGNKLLFNGKQSLLNSDPSVFSQFLGKSIPSFFSGKCRTEFEEGLNEDCENVFQNMPDLKLMPLDKWIDLFIIRYRLAKEDSEYIDSIMPNIMPFAQNSVLNKMLSTSRTKKNHNRINRKIITKFYPRLKKYNLIRNDYKVPYFSCKNNYFSAALYTFLRKTKKGYSNDITLRMVEKCEIMIRKRIISPEFRECDSYRHDQIRELCDDVFIRKNQDSASELLTFLNFDFWQQQCENQDLYL